MRIIYLFLFLLLASFKQSQGQSVDKVFIKGEYYEKPLTEFIAETEAESGLKFHYLDDIVKDVNVNGIFKYKTPFETAFEQLLAGTSLSFYTNENGVVIFKNGKEEGSSVQLFRLRGKVIDKSTEDPLPFVNVYIPALSKGAVTDEKGEFEIKPVMKGRYAVKFHFVGYEPLLIHQNIAKDEYITVELEETFMELEEVTVTPGAFEIYTLEVSPMTLGKEEILHSPNFAKDIFRTLRTLPGVVNDDFSAKARIRGGHYSEVAVYLDNFRIEEPFHLEEANGSFSIFNTDYVNEMKVLTGGFSVKYADRLSGIMDVSSYNYVEKDQATAFIDLLNLGVTLQKNWGKADAFLAFRHGYLDYLIGNFEEINPDGTLRPRFYDVWSKVNYELNDKNQLSVNLLYAKDNFLYEDVDQFSNKYLLQNISLNKNLWLNWKWFPSERFGITTTAGYQEIDKNAQFKFVESVFDQNFDEKNGKAALVSSRLFWDITDAHTLEMGVEGERFFADYFYRELRYDIFETEPENVHLDTLFIDTKFDGYQIAAYIQENWKVSDRFMLQPGLRVSGQSFTESDAYWSPRLALSYKFSKTLDARAAYGWYYQPDSYLKMRTAMGQTRPFEEVAHNTQYTASLTYHTDKLNVQANAYYKDYHKLFDDYRFEFFNRINGINILDRPYNTQSGTSKGIEFMARKQYGNNMLMVSYALAENKIFNEKGEEAYRDYDQRHSVIVENIFRLPYHWNISLLWRFHTGHPYTPSRVDFVGVSDFSDRSIIFYEMGKKNSARLPNVHSLDFKIEKNWFLPKGKVTAYLNIVNLYNRENIRSYWWELYRNRRTGILTTERNYQSNIPFFISPGISYTFY